MSLVEGSVVWVEEEEPGESLEASQPVLDTVGVALSLVAVAKMFLELHTAVAAGQVGYTAEGRIRLLCGLCTELAVFRL